MSEFADPSHRPSGSDAGTPLHRRWQALLLVFVGGIAGTALRYAVQETFASHGTGWPWATLAINVSGACVLGALLEALVAAGPDTGWRRDCRLLVGTGFCGSFTTYSSFALEVTELGRHHAVWTAIAYATVSVVLGIAGAWGGMAATRTASRRVRARRS